MESMYPVSRERLPTNQGSERTYRRGAEHQYESFHANLALLPDFETPFVVYFRSGAVEAIDN